VLTIDVALLLSPLAVDEHPARPVDSSSRIGGKIACVQSAEHGVLVTVNSDDPAYFPGYVAENLATLQREARLTRDDIGSLIRNAIVVSWLDEPDRAAYLDRVEAWVAAR